MSNNFGTLLRQRRKKAGYTIAGLAGILKIAAAQVSAIERGIEAPLSNKRILELSRLWGVDPGPLIFAAKRDLQEEFNKQWSL